MGLDMYLSKKLYVGSNRWRSEDEKELGIKTLTGITWLEF